MITIEKYETGDWNKIKDPVEPFSFMASGDDFDRIAERSVAVTAYEDKKVMACGGITFMNETEGVVWVKTSWDCSKRYIMWARTIRETFQIMMKSVGDIEIYTYILDNFCKGEKLAKLINLSRTGKSLEHNGNTYNKYSAAI